MYSRIRTAAGAIALALLAPACAEMSDSPLAAPDAVTLSSVATTTVVMSGLNSPRGLAWGPGGALYVAEAGTAGTGSPCATVARGTNCYLGTGSISRLRRGEQQRIITGLPSAYNAAVSDIVGVHDIAFQGAGRMLVSIGWGGAPDLRAQLGMYARGFGSVLHVARSGDWKVITDVSALENANPAGGPVDSNPYGLLAESNRYFITDAGGNSLIEIKPSGRASVIATFPSRPVPPGFPPQFTEAEAVPTEVTRGPDGALYVSTLTGVPFVPGMARIWRVVPGQAPTVFADGLTMITDMDWADDGSLYVLQYAAMPFFGGPGSVVRIAPNGTRTTIVSNLTNPTSILAAPDGSIYVSNRGNVAGVGEVLRIVP